MIYKCIRRVKEYVEHDKFTSKKDNMRKKSKSSSKLLLFLSSVLFSIAFLGILLPTAYAQDMGAVAVDMANEMRDLPVTSTVRIMVLLTGITFYLDCC